MVFRDRFDAGHRLAALLKKNASDMPIILALPRGGVVVGYEIAKLLKIPLQVIVARKIGAPNNREFGIGAISEENTTVLDKATINILGISKEDIDDIISRENEEMKRRIILYRHNRPLPSLHNRTAIIVDDGLATGVTAMASIKAVKKLKPKRILFAVPVCAYETGETIKDRVDEFICLHCPYDFQAISLYYQNFPQTTDGQVVELLNLSPFP